MVAPLIPIALSLAAEFAPGLIRHLAGDKAADVAEKVVSAAQGLTGGRTDDVAAALRANPELALAFRQHMANVEVELEQAYLADRQDARARDVEFIKTGRRNYRADIMVAMAAVGLVSCLIVLATYRNTIPGEVVGILSTIAGIFGACLKDAFSFEFGSSRSSKDKDSTIAELSK